MQLDPFEHMATRGFKYANYGGNYKEIIGGPAALPAKMPDVLYAHLVIKCEVAEASLDEVDEAGADSVAFLVPRRLR